MHVAAAVVLVRHRDTVVVNDARVVEAGEPGRDTVRTEDVFGTAASDRSTAAAVARDIEVGELAHDDAVVRLRGSRREAAPRVVSSPKRRARSHRTAARLAHTVMAIPFPVAPEYRIRATVRLLLRAKRPDGEPESGLFAPGDDYPRFVEAKLGALSGETTCRRFSSALSDSDFRGLAFLACTVAEAQPDRLTVADGRIELPSLGVWLQADIAAGSAGCAAGNGPMGERVAAHLNALPPAERIADAVALAIEEDYVMFRGATNASPDRAHVLHVCLPSGWSASDKVGLDFSAIHVTVPHNAPLRAAHHGLIRSLINRGPFVRYVWGLHRDDELCHDPHRHTQPPEVRGQSPEEAAGSTWFRVERQTTCGLPGENVAFFFIRVFQTPLVAAITTAERARTMAAALRDMTPELAAYKSLVHRREPLIAWLESRAASLDG